MTYLFKSPTSYCGIYKVNSLHSKLLFNKSNFNKYIDFKKYKRVDSTFEIESLDKLDFPRFKGYYIHLRMKHNHFCRPGPTLKLTGEYLPVK